VGGGRITAQPDWRDAALADAAAEPTATGAAGESASSAVFGDNRDP